MAGEVVIDASVAAKVFFDEDDSELAEAALAGTGPLIAPDLLFAELASIAAKRVRRGQSTAEQGRQAVTAVGELLFESAPTPPLAARAFTLAAEHGFSAYDGVYLALAEQRGLRMLTADAKLARRAAGAGLSTLVWLLGE